MWAKGELLSPAVYPLVTPPGSSGHSSLVATRIAWSESVRIWEGRDGNTEGQEMRVSRMFVYVGENVSEQI